MPSIQQRVFAGARLAIEPRLLDSKYATVAHNALLRDGSLWPRKASRMLIEDAGYVVRDIFKVPDGGDCCGPLLTWDHCVSVIPAPNPGGLDAYEQIIIFHQNNREPAQRYFKCDGEGGTYYPLEISPPTRRLTMTLLDAGELKDRKHVGPDQRAYTYTWVDRFGTESRPAPPSLSYMSWDDQTWRLTGFSDPPSNAVAMRVYRATSAFEDGSKISNPLDTSFQLVEEVALPADLTAYDDERRLLTMDYGTLLTTLNNPVPPMQQVVATESGYFVGWQNNVIYISEKNEPHNWPTRYVMTLPDRITGIASFYDTIFVGTTGNPYRFNVAFKAMGDEADAEAIPTPYAEVYPLHSRNTLVPTNRGVMFSCPRGIVELTMDSPARLISKDRIGERKWSDHMPVVAAYKNGHYIGARAAGSAIVFDIDAQSEMSMSLGDFTTADIAALCMHTGRDGKLYYGSGNTVMVWEDAQTVLDYTWRSKVFRQPGLTGFSAAKIVGDFGPPVTFNIYADGELYSTHSVVNSKPFRLPKNGRAIDWQFELIGATHVTEVHIATSVTEMTEEQQP